MLTQVTAEVLDVPGVSQALAGEDVAGGIKAYVDSMQPNYRTVSVSVTAASNDFIFADTSGGAFSITLPAAPQPGAAVTIVDVASNFSTEPVTVLRNGQNIMGSANSLAIDEDHAAVRLVFSNATYGWRIVV